MQSFPPASALTASVLALSVLIHPATSTEPATNCTPNGDVFVGDKFLQDSCTVTFFQYESTDRNAMEADFSCTEVIGNDALTVIGEEEAFVWPDRCVEDDPVRCYTIEEFQRILSLVEGSFFDDTILGGDLFDGTILDGELFDGTEFRNFTVPDGVTNLMVNCTGADNGFVIPQQTAQALSKLSSGAIAGIVIGVLVLVVLCLCCLKCICC